MKIKRSDLKRIIENFLREEDEKKQVSSEEIEQSIRDAEDDIVSNQTANKRKEFLKKHGKKIPENVIQSLGSMARPLILKLNKSDLKKDSILLSRVFSFLRKGENQTAIDILKSVKEVPVNVDRKNKKIIKRKLSSEGLKAINSTEDYLQIIQVIEKYIEAGKKEVKDDYDFLSGGNEEESEATPSKPASRKKYDSEKVKNIQTILKELGFKDHDNKDISPDGLLGPSTRVAISYFLKSINDDVAIFDQLQIKRLEDDPLFDQLNTNEEGGEGSWEELTMKLLPPPLNIDNSIDGLIFMLEKYKETDKLSGQEKSKESTKENPEKDYFGDSEDHGQSEQEETPKEKSKESIYKIDNIYTELDKNYHLRKNEKITLDKISLGAFNKLSTNTYISNLFFFDPPTYETPEDAMSGIGWIRGSQQWKDNKRSGEDINVYFEESGWVNNIVFKDGYSDRSSQTNGKHTSLKNYTVALDGLGNQNAIIGGYIAVKDPEDSKIYLMSIKRAKKEGFVKEI